MFKNAFSCWMYLNLVWLYLHVWVFLYMIYCFSQWFHPTGFHVPSWSCRVWECLCVMLLPWQHMMIKSYTSELLWDRQQNPISPLRQWSNQKSPRRICSTCRHSLHQTCGKLRSVHFICATCTPWGKTEFKSIR